MTNQITAALCAALLFAGSAIAQEPALVPVPAPAIVESPASAAAACCFQDCGCHDPGPHFWFSADYLLAWIPGPVLPSLVTTSPAGTDRSVAGVLGQPTTTILAGGDRVNDSERSGLRFQTGLRFGESRDFGFEAGTMILESKSGIFPFTGENGTILARPFTNANTGAATSVLVAFPGSSTGVVEVKAKTGNFYEVHLDLTERVVGNEFIRVDCLLGYRFFRYDEGLNIGQDIAPTDPSFVPGTRITTGDTFGTQNEFHGADFGFRTHLGSNDLTADVLTKLAVGKISRRVNISGAQVVSVPGSAPLIQAGGVLALSSNIGSYNTPDYTLMPEFGIEFGWRVASHLRLRAGYTAIFLDSIARASEQVNLNVNPNLFPLSTNIGGPQQPSFKLKTSDVWFQSLSLGAEITF
ncbi:MAG: BBP7 family outer membrane beta-barrel protein [Gemmataceae bacterium]|nr:BBP7 family outer membrane beta-barrel protein [Gemmataceae bacterium]